MPTQTTIYGYDKAIHDAAERIIEREILSYQASLVNDALMGDLFDYDDIYHPCDTDGEYREILQWFLVTEWLADKLRAIKEPVLLNEYGTWWGRTCCGQAIILDGTIQEVVLRFSLE